MFHLGTWSVANHWSGIDSPFLKGKRSQGISFISRADFSLSAVRGTNVFFEETSPTPPPRCLISTTNPTLRINLRWNCAEQKVNCSQISKVAYAKLNYCRAHPGNARLDTGTRFRNKIQMRTHRMLIGSAPFPPTPQKKMFTRVLRDPEMSAFLTALNSFHCHLLFKPCCNDSVFASPSPPPAHPPFCTV